MTLRKYLETDNSGKVWKVTRLPYEGPDPKDRKIVISSDHIRKREARAKMRRRAMRGGPVE